MKSESNSLEVCHKSEFRLDNQASTLDLGSATVDPHMVHFGDIKLEPCTGASYCETDKSVAGTLMVYFGTDNRAPEWRPVCGDHFNSVGDRGALAICNMLGYRKLLSGSSPSKESPVFVQ